jgi:hypothetical protein
MMRRKRASAPAAKMLRGCACDASILNEVVIARVHCRRV